MCVINFIGDNSTVFTVIAIFMQFIVALCLLINAMAQKNINRFMAFWNVTKGLPSFEDEQKEIYKKMEITLEMIKGLNYDDREKERAWKDFEDYKAKTAKYNMDNAIRYGKALGILERKALGAILAKRLENEVKSANKIMENIKREVEKKFEEKEKTENIDAI